MKLLNMRTGTGTVASLEVETMYLCFISRKASERALMVLSNILQDTWEAEMHGLVMDVTGIVADFCRIELNRL